MSNESSKDQKAKLPQSTEAPGPESADLQAALAQFTSILNKAALTPVQDDDGRSDKTAH